eukprot:132468_1
MAQTLAPAHRVVVTGIGAISSLGITFSETWSNMLSGYSGVKKNEIEKYPILPCKIAGTIPRIDDEATVTNNDPIHNNNPPHINIYDPVDHLSRQESFYTDPAIQYALTAASEAMQSSNLQSYLNDENTMIDRYRVAVCFATALGGQQSFVKDHSSIQDRAYKKVLPWCVPNRLLNTPAAAISLRYGLNGPNFAPATACSASAHAIQTGYHWIRSGVCDIAVIGGTEAAFTAPFVAGLCRSKALATKYNNEPHKASRPWDKDRNGFVIGEGAACLILESETMASQRGVTDIYGEIVGAASTADAFHCTGLDPSGIHVQKCMDLAIESAKQCTNDRDLIQYLQYINAHATSTDIGDITETKAILAVLEEHQCNEIGNIKINGTKSSIGHLMGAAGAMEAAISLQALKTKTSPPTINLDTIDPRLGIPSYVNLVPHKPQALSDECRYAMSNSFGFGGTNACIIFKKRDSL